mmetsp:Transcript_30327/g.97934  ORF Transcript_30327/g.97934 Transcript_30327/m.97934 type:complete len:203 (-) Transcript_30327:1464-2072(-)
MGQPHTSPRGSGEGSEVGGGTKPSSLAAWISSRWLLLTLPIALAICASRAHTALSRAVISFCVAARSVSPLALSCASCARNLDNSREFFWVRLRMASFDASACSRSRRASDSPTNARRRASSNCFAAAAAAAFASASAVPCALAHPSAFAFASAAAHEADFNACSTPSHASVDSRSADLSSARMIASSQAAMPPACMALACS